MFDTCSFKPTNDGFPPSSGGGGGAVTSVFGRTGVVIAVAGDYNSTQITNSSGVTGAFVTDALNTLDTTKATLNSAVTFGSSYVPTQFEIFSGGQVQVKSGNLYLGSTNISGNFAGYLGLQNSNGTVFETYGGDFPSNINFTRRIQTLNATYDAGTVLTKLNSGSSDVEWGLRNISDYAVSKTLTNGNIIVGNGSNVATAVAMSGDATIINTGALTISNQAVTFAKMQHISSQHLVGRHAAGTGDIQQISLGTGLSFSGSNLQVTGFVPTTLTSANIIVGNNLGVATAVAMSGDTTISNTGAVTISNDAVTTAKILNSNVTYAKIQNVAATRLLGNSTGSPAAPEEITLGTNLSFTGTTLNVTGVVSDTLTSANIIVGNNLGVATAVAMSGDITISNTGATTIGTAKVTTAKILDRNVTFGKIQDLNPNTLIGRGASVFGAAQEITLGTNLSFTGTTLNAAGGGGYTYLAITLSVDTSYNKAALGGANYLFISTSSGTSRRITIDSTGFVVNDFLVLSFNENSLGTINLTIGTTPRAINGNRGNTLLAVYDGTEWTLQALANSVNTSSAVYSNTILGFSSTVGGSILATVFGASASVSGTGGTAIGADANAGGSSVVVGGGNSNATGSASVSIGYTTQGSGSNSVRIGAGTQTGANTGVVAIGQGITSTNTDAVVIGRAAATTSIQAIAIGTSASAGNQSVAIGYQAVVSGSGNSVAIGDRVVVNNASSIAIGASQTINSMDSIAIGHATTGIGATSVVIGAGVTSSGANVVSIGRGNNTGINTGVVAIGQGITTTNTDAVVIGRASSGGGTANVTIGGSATGTGDNCVRIGNGVTTGSNTGVVAIGQGAIISGATATDTILIGRNARNGSGGNQSDTIVIGRDSTTGSHGGSVTTDNNIIIGSNSVIQGSSSGSKTIQRNILLGNSIVMENTTTTSNENYQNNILIGSSLTVGKQTGTGNSSAIIIASNASVGNGTLNSVIIGSQIKGGSVIGFGQNVIIGYQANPSADGSASICIGKGSSLGNSGGGTQAYNLVIGYEAKNNEEKSRVISKGAHAYPLHYGAESRRIDTNTSNTDATNPSRHSENTAWIVQTPDATPVTMTLFGVAGERLTLQNNEAMHFDIMVTAKQTGSTNTFITRIAGGAVRGVGVGTTSIVGQTTLYTHGTALTAVVSADTVNGAVQIQVTGNASVWEWTASVDYQRTRTA